MILFLDTSTLLKLYHKEAGSENLRDLFRTELIEEVYLSEIALLEFASALWKKTRTKALLPEQVDEIITLLKDDLDKFQLIPINHLLLQKAQNLLSTYGSSGLRTLDAIQLASAIECKDFAHRFMKDDKLLYSFFEKEGLTTTSATE